jgi:hypothetical protein
MSPSRRLVVLASLGAMAAPGVSIAAAPCSVATTDLESLLKSARERNRRYVPPTADELRALAVAGRRLVAAAVAGPAATRIVGLPTVLGYHVVATRLGDAPALALVEKRNHRHGGGFYVFRCGPLPVERIIQVPHSFFDEGTLPIGLELARLGSARALFVNTVHRFQGATRRPDGDKRGAGTVAPADLAHAPASAFLTLTAATLDALPQAQIFQIHGFADRDDAHHRKSELVFSPGAALAGLARASATVDRLRAAFGDEAVKLYPRDTDILGGTTNVVGALVANRAQALFFHVELSHSFRERLRRDRRLLEGFARALLEESP